MKLLLPVDGSEYSEAAVQEVAGRPWPEGCVVRVLHVVPTTMLMAAAYAPPAPPLALAPASSWPPAVLETYKMMTENAERLVTGVANALMRTGLSVDTTIREGDARDGIIDEARSWPADLIVIGSHGYTGLKRLLLGSVAQSVVTHAPCSVEVVRRHDRQGEASAGARA